MKVQFTKNVSVDYFDKFNELSERNYRSGTTIEVESVEDMGSFYNIHLNGSEVLIDVPRNAVTIIKNKTI